ncbi:MAG TPA: hypothetical protein VJI46_04295 [Candidatus Nanoarchaeia archaeon]|nr:hypothetical protein [Candidatus Nanoarchaeia archaeon]
MATAVYAGENISTDDALLALLRAEDDRNEMVYNNLSVQFVSDTLLRAQRFFIGNDIASINEAAKAEANPKKKAYIESLVIIARETPSYEVEKQNFTEVIRLTNDISERKKHAYEMLDTNTLLEEEVARLENLSINASESHAMMNRAMVSFREERYEEAEDFFREAELEIGEVMAERKRLTSLAELSKGFFEKYWLHVIILVLAVVVLAFPIVRKISRERTKRKIEHLKIEMETLNGLLKKVQQDYYGVKKIPESIYKIRREKYMQRIAEIKHTIPVYEGMLEGKKKEVKK